MSAYRSPGRLTPAAQRLDLVQLRADRRRLETGSQTPGLGDCEWHWTDLKTPPTVPFRRRRNLGSTGSSFEESTRFLARSE